MTLDVVTTCSKLLSLLLLLLKEDIPPELILNFDEMAVISLYDECSSDSVCTQCSSNYIPVSNGASCGCPLDSYNKYLKFFRVYQQYNKTLYYSTKNDGTRIQRQKISSHCGQFFRP